MHLRKPSPTFALALLALVLTLPLTSCATCPEKPEALLPLTWPVLASPPSSLEIDGDIVLVPLDYFTELVGYIAAADTVRMQLVREGRIVE